MSSPDTMVEERAMAKPSFRVRKGRQMPLRILWVLAGIYCAIIAAALAVIYRESIHWSVVAPLIVTAAIVLLFLLYLRGIERTLPYFEIGAFYVAITAIYIIYPLLKYVLQGYRYETGDYRIMLLQYQPEALTAMGWWYVLYLVSFCLAYVLVRGRRAIQGRLVVARTNWTLVSSILLLLTCARLFFVVLGYFFDMKFTSYLESYVVIQRLPLVVRQIAAQVQGIDLTLQLMLIVALTCARGRSFRTLKISYLMITIVSNLLAPGGRIQLVAIILAAVGAHHLVVRRVRLRLMIAAAVLGFLSLLVMAALRTNGTSDLAALKARMGDHTEFEVIFGNALDLKYLQYASGMFTDKPNLYWSGIFAIIPQQILPMGKDNAGDWYVRTFYPEYFESGGGLAFGVLAEAVTGYGWPELIWRGAVVGMAFALLHRGLYRPRVSVYFLMFYLWVMVWSYLTVRSGTFSILMLITHRFLPPLAGLALLGLLLPRGRALLTRLKRAV